jgi:cell division protein FtsI/penicillin-binding protein 2
VAALAVVVGALVLGFTGGGFGGEASAEPAVQTFLLEWQNAHYAQAAALTTGTTPDVSAQLAAAYTDLDATHESFAMQNVTQHGATAVATFVATVDLAGAGQQWSYTGKFGLTSSNGHWTVNWAPSVINPSLGPGDRLAAETTYAPRAALTDVHGQSLLSKSATYRIGVYPGKLKSALATANGLAAKTGLDEQQVLGQIQAAPPGEFLSLLTLSPADFSALWPKLSKVPGLGYQKQPDRLFASTAQDVVGSVGTENSGSLREEGAAYQPGMTIGVTGLEKTYQDSLIGTPTTAVEVVNKAGHVTKQWILKGGHAGTPVQTTLDLKQQAAAVSALAGQPSSAEIIAVNSATGGISVLATHSAGDLALPAGGPVNARVQPGMAFSIVSAAALLATGITADHPLPCEPVADVGGETFTYQPATSSTSTFEEDFANGCGTAFANMSRTLTPEQLSSAERAFGIGSDWQLPMQAFSGAAPPVSGEAQVAAQVTGAGGVLMSPLGMVTVAAEVASGTGRSPVLIATDQSKTWAPPLSGAGLTELRQLMQVAVAKGAAHAAFLPGTPVYGQAGVVQTGKQSYLSWFVGYRGTTAVAVLETGRTASAAAASLAGTFLKSVG